MMNAESKTAPGPTRELARWVSRLKYSALPQRTREVVRIVLLDTLGCGVYGYATPWAKMLLKWARAGASGIATAKLLMKEGARHIIACDRAGILFKGRTENMNSMKEWFAEQIGRAHV